ncbi:MAG: hypothetical protein ACFFBD_01980 [Candidatus Hodarchaeota archaeon]
MEIPPIDHKRWNDVVSGKLSLDFNFFPLKLLLARLNLEMLTNPGPETTERCIKEVRELFIKNQTHPKVKKDLRKIFGRRKLFGFI